jgi:NDP-sugar pyrophosphorylase family protein
MKALLICPDERPEVSLLSADMPLAAVPALGQGLVEYWMSHFACTGVKEVTLLASDRPDAIREVVGSGSRWGIAIEVVAEARELNQNDALERYEIQPVVMDHFPGLPEHRLFESYEQWFNGLIAWMPHAMTPDRVGAREFRPGIWVGRKGHISPQAHLCPPCWLGDHVYVGAGATVGPGAILENGAFIEPNVEIRSSVVGPATFVGQYLQVGNHLVLGNTLLAWQTGLETKISDAFLLCSLNQRATGIKLIPLLDRVVGWLNRWKDEAPLEPAMEPQPILIKNEVWGVNRETPSALKGIGSRIQATRQSGSL